MSLLATGHLLTIVAASVLRFRSKPSEVNVLPIDLPPARVPNGVITLKDRTLSPVAQLFVEHARAVAHPLANKVRRQLGQMSRRLLMLWTAPPPGT